MFLFSLLLLFFFLLYSFINQNILVNKDYDLKDGEKVNEQEHDPDQDQEQDQEESQDQDQGHHEFETDSQQSNNDYEHYDELNQSFLIDLYKRLVCKIYICSCCCKLLISPWNSHPLF